MQYMLCLRKKTTQAMQMSLTYEMVLLHCHLQAWCWDRTFGAAWRIPRADVSSSLLRSCWTAFVGCSRRWLSIMRSSLCSGFSTDSGEFARLQICVMYVILCVFVCDYSSIKVTGSTKYYVVCTRKTHYIFIESVSINGDFTSIIGLLTACFLMNEIKCVVCVYVCECLRVRLICKSMGTYQ